MVMIFCLGCGAQVPDIDGPVHAYMASAPGCWQTYGEVLAAEYSDVTYWPAHQLTVDTYTGDDRRRVRGMLGRVPSVGRPHPGSRLSSQLTWRSCPSQ